MKVNCEDISKFINSKMSFTGGENLLQHMYSENGYDDFKAAVKKMSGGRSSFEEDVFVMVLRRITDLSDWEIAELFELFDRNGKGSVSTYDLFVIIAFLVASEIKKTTFVFYLHRNDIFEILSDRELPDTLFDKPAKRTEPPKQPQLQQLRQGQSSVQPIVISSTQGSLNTHHQQSSQQSQSQQQQPQQSKDQSQQPQQKLQRQSSSSQLMPKSSVKQTSSVQLSPLPPQLPPKPRGLSLLKQTSSPQPSSPSPPPSSSSSSQNDANPPQTMQSQQDQQQDRNSGIFGNSQMANSSSETSSSSAGEDYEEALTQEDEEVIHQLTFVQFCGLGLIVGLSPSHVYRCLKELGYNADQLISYEQFMTFSFHLLSKLDKEKSVYDTYGNYGSCTPGYDFAGRESSSNSSIGNMSPEFEDSVQGGDVNNYDIAYDDPSKLVISHVCVIS